MALPILFFHYGNPKYLKYSLKQAKHFNPDSIIYLLGDKANNCYPFVHHVMMEKYDEQAKDFTKVYKHKSTNEKNYELNCFLRWFYIEAFCREHHIGPFIYLDSDVLLFKDVSTMEPFFTGCTIANTGDTCGVPAFTYFSGHKAIKDFCDYMMLSYTKPELWQQLEEFYKPYAEHPELEGGISDMILFHFYFRDHPTETKKLDLINDELAVDENIRHANGYEMGSKIKKIYWQNGIPYCKHLALNKLIPFAAFHYQGDFKIFMMEHFTGGGYTIQRAWEIFRMRFKRTKKAVKKLFKSKRPSR